MIVKTFINIISGLKGIGCDPFKAASQNIDSKSQDYLK